MGTLIIHSEEQLVQLLRQGSKDAFDHLYKHYGATLYGVIGRIVGDEQIAQDVLQEVFVKIWNSISLYDSGRGKLYTWMINIARNAAIDKVRSRGEVMKSKIRSADDNVHYLDERGATETKTDTIGVAKMVEQLKPEYEVVIKLAYFEGYTTDEIAKELSIPQGTVKTRMRTAIKQLRTFFKS